MVLRLLEHKTQQHSTSRVCAPHLHGVSTYSTLRPSMSRASLLALEQMEILKTKHTGALTLPNESPNFLWAAERRCSYQDVSYLHVWDFWAIDFDS